MGLLLTPTGGNGIENDVHAVVSVHQLLCKLEKVRTSPSPPDFVEWEEWGPPMTRWFGNRDISETSFRSIAGSRLLGQLPLYTRGDYIEPLKDMLLMFDFNMRDVRRRAAVTSTTPVADSLQVFRTYTDDRKLFNAGGSAVDILSSLPCCVRTVKIGTADYLDFFLEDHAIIGKGVSGFV